MVAKPHFSPTTLIQDNPDYQPLHDAAELQRLVDQVVADNPSILADYKAGKVKGFGFLVGQIMKLSRGKASPTIVNELLLKKLK